MERSSQPEVLELKGVAVIICGRRHNVAEGHVSVPVLGKQGAQIVRVTLIRVS